MNLFTLESGSYEFREGELPSDEMITIHASTSTIIYRGVRRIRNVMLARKICPPEDGVLGLSSSPLDLFQEINLDDRDKIILSYMNGRTLKMILSLSPMQDFDTMRTICALMTVGLVTTRREGDSPSPVTVENLLKEPDEGVSENFLVEVEEMLRGCDSSGCYEILGLERGASEEEIESAYFRLAKRFHPDRHYSLPTHDIKKGLIRIFSCITHAYELLMDREKRQAYDMNPSPVKDAVTEEIPESIFTLSGITDTVGASGETAGEIAGEAEEEESAVPPEDGGDREDERKTPEPVDLDGETPFQDGPLTPSARIEAKTAADKAGEGPEEAAVPVEKGGIEVEKTRMILEEIGTENRGGDFSEEKTEPVAVEEPRKRGHGVLMPVAVTVVLVVLVALAVSLTYQDRKEVPVAPVSPSATVENEGMRGASREVYVELPTFRDDLFRKFLHDSEKREDD
jgi:curved DNA-binding protein CbpA